MKRMLMIVLIILCCSLISVNVVAEPVNATFAWEQPGYADVNYWVLYWGETPGGPYTIDSLQITKELAQESQTVPVEINYPANAVTTYYYVLVAFKDAEHHSGDSNETSLEADLIDDPLTPVQLRVIITPPSP